MFAFLRPEVYSPQQKENRSMIRTVSALMVIISVAVIGCFSIFLSREFTKVVNLCSMGDMWSFLDLRENSPYATFAEVEENGFTIPASGSVFDDAE